MLPTDLPDWDTRTSPGIDVLITTLELNAGQSSPNINVGPYRAVVLSVLNASAVSAIELLVSWLDKDGQQVQSDSIQKYNAPTEFGPLSAQIPARAATFSVINYSGPLLNIDVSGTNRPTSGLTVAGYQDIAEYANPAAAMTAGTFYPLGPNPQTVSQGWHQIEFSVSGTTVGGSVYLQYGSGNSSATNALLVSTGQTVAVGTNRHYSGQVILPAQRCDLRFLCEIAGTATLTVSLIALGH